MYEFGSHDRLSYFFLGLNFEKNKTKIIFVFIYLISLFQEKAKKTLKEFKKVIKPSEKTHFFWSFQWIHGVAKNVGHK